MASINQIKVDLEERSMRSLLDARTSHDLKIVAEGDSWFSYPIVKDIIDHLREMGYAIKRHSRPGDTLENMVYGTDFSIASSVKRANNHGPVSLTETLRSIQNLKPKFVLFSGGGNDVIGPELSQYLHHKKSGLPLFREAFYRDSINGYIKTALTDFLTKVWKTDPGVHVIMHGYDYAIPNGTRYEFAGIQFSGPWVLPNFAKKAITAREDQNQIIRQLVDIFNELLISLDEQYSHFHHIDLRGMFSKESEWHNEIHLKREGFEKVARLFHQKMVQILAYNPVVSAGID